MRCIRQYARSAMARSRSRLAKARPGERNAALNREAYGLYRLVAAGAVAESAVSDLLVAESLVVGLERPEILGTLQSARAAAFAKPAFLAETRMTSDAEREALAQKPKSCATAAHAGCDRQEAEAEARREIARWLWSRASPLRESGRRCLSLRAIPAFRSAALRELPPSPPGHPYPALIAAVTDSSGGIVAVQLTAFDPFSGAKAPIDPPRRTIGRLGGGAVRLFDTVGPGALLLAEGVETAVSAGLLRARSGEPLGQLWACLGSAGLAAAELPPAPGELVVAADRDAAGLRAARRLRDRAMAAGWTVRLWTPSPPHHDFNDLLRGGAAHG